MVHAENGVSGVGLGITVTRPAAVGSFGTVRETMIFFCSIAQDVAWYCAFLATLRWVLRA